MTNKWVPNPMLEEELKRSAMFVPGLTRVAEAAKNAIVASAPVDSGDFRAGIHVEHGANERGEQVARIVSDDWKSVFIEFGTAEHPFSAPIRRGIEQAGYKLVDDNGGSDE